MKPKLLAYKGYQLLLLAFFAYEVVASAKILHRPSSLHNWYYIFGLFWAILCFGLLSFKSIFRRERLMYGSVAFIMALSASLAAIKPSQPIIHVIRWLMLSGWLVAAISAFVLVIDRTCFDRRFGAASAIENATASK
jgi:hypothetical protein